MNKAYPDLHSDDWGTESIILETRRIFSRGSDAGKALATRRRESSANTNKEQNALTEAWFALLRTQNGRVTHGRRSSCPNTIFYASPARGSFQTP